MLIIVMVSDLCLKIQFILNIKVTAQLNYCPNSHGGQCIHKMYNLFYFILFYLFIYLFPLGNNWFSETSFVKPRMFLLLHHFAFGSFIFKGVK